MTREHLFVMEWRPPTPREYAQLRTEVGWHPVQAAAVERGLAGALCSVCATAGGSIIGCGRLVGDGGIYFYLQDVIVLPAWQGRGVGTAITRALLEQVVELGGNGSFAGLMAAEGKAGFYERFGFKPRPPGKPGMDKVR